jgi:ribosomal protein S20
VVNSFKEVCLTLCKDGKEIQNWLSQMSAAKDGIIKVNHCSRKKSQIVKLLLSP